MKHVIIFSLQMATVGLLLFTAYVHITSLDEEAKKAVMDYYINRKIFTIYGDSFYGYNVNKNNKNQWAIGQGKEFHVNAKSQPLTYANNLNGVEWKGTAGISARAFRRYVPKAGWSEWISLENNNPDLIVQKKGEKWFIDPTGEAKEHIESFQPVDCKKIEAMTK